MGGWVGGWVDGWMRAHARPSLCCGRVYLPRAPGSLLVALRKLRIDSTYRYAVLKSYGASEKLRIESYAAPITPHRKLRRPRPLPYTPSYPPCASGRHGARSAPQGLSYTTRRQRGWMTPFAAIFRAMRRVFTVLIAHSIVLFYRADRQRRPESSKQKVTRRSNYSR